MSQPDLLTRLRKSQGAGVDQGSTESRPTREEGGRRSATVPTETESGHRPDATGQVFEIQEVNGVSAFTVNIDGPGVWVALGPNGAGKSSTINAVLAACGDKSAVAEPTDGVAKGRVLMGDGVVFAVGSRRLSTGQPAIRLVSTSSIDKLIDPGLVDEGRAAQARIKAITELMPMPADEEARRELTANDPELARHIEHDPATDALMLAESVRNRANEMALTEEKRALAKAGEMATYEKLIGELGTVDFEAGDYESARVAAEEAMRRAEVMSHTATQRQQLERQQQAIRETLGERPEGFEVTKEIAVLSNRIAELDREMAETREKLRTATNERIKLEQAAKVWDANSAVLKREVNGPTLDEAEAARLEAEALSGRALRAQVLANAQSYSAEHQQADMVKHEAEGRAKVLRGIAQGTGDALGRLLERRGLPGLAIADGRLCVRDGDRLKDFDKRLSFGERVRVALGVALAGIDVNAPEHRSTGNRLPLLPLSPVFWTALDKGHQAEVAQIARERGVCLITEAPGEGELRFERV